MKCPNCKNKAMYVTETIRQCKKCDIKWCICGASVCKREIKKLTKE